MIKFNNLGEDDLNGIEEEKGSSQLHNIKPDGKKDHPNQRQSGEGSDSPSASSDVCEVSSSPIPGTDVCVWGSWSSFSLLSEDLRKRF